jgi:hypothetical protein
MSGPQIGTRGVFTRAAGLAAVLVDADASLPPTQQEPSLSGGRCVRVRSLGEVAAAIGRLVFP